MNKTMTKIGPVHNGRRMSLDDFDHAEVVEGHLYELSRGIITVTDIPGRRHMLVVSSVKDELNLYKASHPGRVRYVLTGSECKLLIQYFDSERHPDLSVYLTPLPDVDDDLLWTQWVPELVIEVVSPSSRQRDYHEKPEEYLRFGVKEYWIVDADERVMVVMRRSRARWLKTTVRPHAVHRTRLLPGLEFSIQAVFEAAGLR
jgi:Uma2 family endonuclease